MKKEVKKIMKNKVREYILNIPLFTYFNLIIMSGVIDTSEEYKIISSIIENIKQSYINESHSLNLFFNVIDNILIFFDRLIQTERSIENTINCKSKIIDNIININKEICESSIHSYFSSINHENTLMIVNNESFSYESSVSFDTFNQPSSTITDESELKNADILLKIKNKLKEKTKNIITISNDEISERISEEDDTDEKQKQNLFHSK